ncbi:hypothetical protein, variant [Aphanomyces invadans]|uniref:FYVE-type domain-containing protein n=1 Tax=Aphanomyces invadans TaxID=157072 RepID=A0A024TSJ6_9STRA|nr:hypothetical protein H310_10477 [Aphanomyces invadans]XP_008875105.1 hypothetical protein, variant [Aphanomyces invadans]ETV96312.1 hypothetical protein H310_10477 [Aphanomyces invadans]ETV96313.1 hypothetical protein, variant [Aphanomyces invadans]|eukprot:XP_008875104.1 hypothetical protein H310_10477 [Aphanomyces invadans]
MTRQAVARFELTREQLVEFTARTKTLLRDTLHLLSLDQRLQHGTKVMERMGLQVYTDGDSTTITGHLATTIVDLEYAMYATTTQHVQTVAAIMHNELYNDADVLDVQQSQTLEDTFHFVGVKSVALARKGMFAKPHHIVYLESTGTIHDDGTARLYQHIEYVDMAHYYYTAKNSWSKAIRPICSTVSLFEADPCDATSVRVYSRAHYSHDTPSSLYQMHQPQVYWQWVLSLASLAVSRRLMDATSLVQYWVPNGECKSCSVCNSAFKALRPKHHCRSCGEMMCHGCSIHIRSPTVVHKFCTKCVLKSRELRGGDRVEQPPKTSLWRPMSSVASSSSSTESFIRSMQETTKHVTTPSPHVVATPSAVDAKQVNALEQISDSIAHQESILVCMREVLEKQKRHSDVTNSMTSTTGTADSYMTDECLETLPSTSTGSPNTHQFEYIDSS